MGNREMFLRKITAAAAPLVVAVALGSGTAAAEPAAAPQIGYETKLVGDKIVTTLTGGTFEITGNAVDIDDADGNAVLTLPLSFRHDGLEFPLPHAVRDDGRTLELTAVKDYARATPVPVTAIASPIENRRAMDQFTSQFAVATSIGGFLGTAIGAGIGLIGFLGGAFGLATVVTGAAIGGLVGTLIVGGPTLIVAGIELIQTLNAPDGTTKWADNN
ncbi:ammonium transporter [Nocardia sp. NPDC048505]|uniref:ammonium transporter n=1 Tax=unclassified Nocardia TaxID=2637762 RepID=UPI0033FFD3D2